VSGEDGIDPKSSIGDSTPVSSIVQAFNFSFSKNTNSNQHSYPMLYSDAFSLVPALDAKVANCVTPRGRKERFAENRGIETTNGKTAKATINMHGSFKLIQPPSMEHQQLPSSYNGQKMVSTLRAGNINSLLTSPARSGMHGSKFMQ
jgi:hypothetical protein